MNPLSWVEESSGYTSRLYAVGYLLRTWDVPKLNSHIPNATEDVSGLESSLSWGICAIFGTATRGVSNSVLFVSRRIHSWQPHVSLGFK